MRHQSKTGERRISDFFSPFFNQRGREEEDKSVFVFLSILAMTERTRARASYWNQAHALLAKNFIFQKRHMSDTLAVIGFSILFLSMFKATSNKYKPLQPGCRSDDNSTCEFLIPPKWPPVLKIPKNEDRAVRADFMSYSDLPNKSCRKRGSCPITILLTGSNQSIAQDVARHMLPTTLTRNSSNPLDILSGLVLGSDLPLSDPFGDGLDPAFLSSLYAVQQNCSSDSPMMLPLEKTGTEMKCVQGLDLWRNSSSEMNDEIFKGYSQGNPERQTNEIAAAYDFLNSGKNNLDITIWYNSTSEFPEGAVTESLLQVSRLVNLVSNAYLQFLRGPGTKMVLEFIKEMPKFNVSHEGLSLYKFGASLILTSQIHIVSKSLVYDKQHDVRIMMKMHGLGDLTYWMITYGFQLYISSISIPILVGGGMLLGIEYFTKNDWSLQIVFYFLNACLQVSVAFFISAFFCNVKTASVANSLVILLSFISGFFVLDPLLSKASLPGVLVLALEIFPFFALYRGVYEIDQYTARAKILGVDVLSSGNGTRRSPLFFLPNIQRKPSLKSVGSQVSDQMEKPDVAREREKVDRLMLESSANHAIVVNQLRKVYPGRDGNPEKLAVNGLSLALPQAECFGMLGPNGAGKTSFIKMMIGLSEPTFGTALVQGLDIMTHMDEIYCSMGVCPQHDLLWDCLTGREHLMFYGRLKNLKGAALSQAVEESLKGLNLFNGGVPDKVAGKYSGGMKRRLSVAISLIGDPKVVYMDEPSTGLDPASRINLWNVVRRAKQDRAIILTTHSMEEAEALCDRLGIFMNGELQCIGNSKELKARYGGTFVFTMTTTSDYDAEVESMVKGLCQNARKIYHLPGTQKFELPKHEVQIADVFELVEISRNRFPVHAWGLADTTLEDVFIKVIKDAQVKAVPALT